MRAVVFDLDGTLIDSAPDIHAAVNMMLAEEGCEALTLARVISFIGNGLPRLTELAIEAAGLAMSDHGRLTARVLEHYNAENGRQTRLYPGVLAALGALQARGLPMAICTNKPRAPALHVLAEFGLADFFFHVIGGDSLPERKPDPAPLMACAAHLGVSATEMLYVGDSEVDAETARRAGVAFALYSGGYRKSPAHEMGADHVFDDFAALPALVGEPVAL